MGFIKDGKCVECDQEYSWCRCITRSKMINDTDIGITHVKEGEKEVPPLLSRLDERLSVLDKELESLAVQLVPIMSDAIVNDLCGDGSKQSNRCELAIALDSKIDIIDGFIQRIGSMRSRIEL